MTGLFEDYRLPAHLAQAAPSPGTVQAWAWEDILPRWTLVVADLASLRGVDLTDPAVWRRPWPPLRDQIFLLQFESRSRLRRALGGD